MIQSVHYAIGHPACAHVIEDGLSNRLFGRREDIGIGSWVCNINRRCNPDDVRLSGNVRPLPHAR